MVHVNSGLGSVLSDQLQVPAGGSEGVEASEAEEMGCVPASSLTSVNRKMFLYYQDLL